MRTRSPCDALEHRDERNAGCPRAASVYIRERRETRTREIEISIGLPSRGARFRFFPALFDVLGLSRDVLSIVLIDEEREIDEDFGIIRVVTPSVYICVYISIRCAKSPRFNEDFRNPRTFQPDLDIK